MDQPGVELLVRLTARVSAATFAAALILFAARDQQNRRRLNLGARLFAGFVVAHTVHFLTVAWLAVVTAGENIRERDGWPVVVTVALLFYLAVFSVLRAWGDAARGRPSSRNLRVTANVAVVAIAAVFLNSYLGRVARMPVYWFPAAGLAGIVVVYFVRTRGAARQWAVLGVLVLMVDVDVAAQQWPQFRGEQAGVAVDDPALPDTWSETRNIAWKIDIPGRGWSSPVVWGDHVFVTSAINVREPKQSLLPPDAYRGASMGGTMSRRDLVKDTDVFRWMLYDIDLHSGRVRWERVIHEGVPTRPVHMKNSYASETPVTDGERVYVYLGYVGLFAYELNGTLSWARPMDARNTGNDGYFYGGGASPALDAGRVYIVNDNEEASFVAAFDARTGTELWRVARDERSNWSTPYVWRNELRTELVTVGSRKVRSYGPDGGLLWELAVGTTLHTPTPFARSGLLYVNSGYYSDPKRPVFAIRPGASGDISLADDETANAFVAWSLPTVSATYPSAIVVGDHFYTLLDRGFLTAHDARTGKEIYGRQRLAIDAGTFSASPWSYNGRIFALSEDGETFVIQAGPEYKLLARNSLNEMSLASPAVAGHSLFIRTATKLYRISEKR